MRNRSPRNRRALAAVGVALSMLTASTCAALTVALAVDGGVAEASATPAGSSVFVAIDHVRIADTAAHTGYVSAGARAYQIALAGTHGVPTSATAAVVNLTVSGSVGFGGAVAFESGTTMGKDWNVIAEKSGQTVSNLVHVALAADGSFTVYTSVAMTVRVDLEGYYVPAFTEASAGRYQQAGALGSAPAVNVVSSQALAANTDRVVDLSTTTGDVSGAPLVPFGSNAVLLSVSVDHAPTQCGTGCNWRVYGVGAALPATYGVTTDASSTARTNQVMVRLVAGSRSIHVRGSAAARISISVVGWFTGVGAPLSTDGMFVRSTHARRLDTRNGRYIPPVGANTFEFPSSAPYEASAVVANVMWSGMWQPGVVKGGAAGIGGDAVLLSVDRNARSVAAQAVLPTSTRGSFLTATQGGNLIVDIEGWYLGATPAAVGAVPTNPSQVPAVVKAVTFTDKTGTHTLQVKRPSRATDTNLEPIADAGIAASYNDMSTLGKAMDVIVFAHRTKQPPYCARYVGWPCTGPFHNIDTIKLGAIFKLQDTSGHWWTYRVENKAVTPARFSAITAPAAKYPPATAQLIACSKPDGSPTSLYYRIVVTGRLIAYN